jgi:hypothetical protein
MANELDQLNLSQSGTLPPELFAQQQQLNRQQQMANMLMSQNQQPQGQMISGRYVAPSWTQQLAPIANMLTGAYLSKQGDTKAAQLAEQLRTGRESERQAAIPLLKQSKFDEVLALPNTYGGVTPFQDIATKRIAPEATTNMQEFNEAMKNPQFAAYVKEQKLLGRNVNNINMPAVETEYNKTFGKGIAEQDLALKNIAEGAKSTVNNIANQKKILESGNFFSGKAANIQSDLAGYGTALGVVGKTGQEKAANTQSLISGGAGVTLDNIKGSGLGAGQGFTDKDLQFLQDAKSFKITWNKENIARALDLQERAAIEGAKKWNARQGQIQKSATAPINVGQIEVPAPYSGQVKFLGVEGK